MQIMVEAEPIRPEPRITRVVAAAAITVEDAGRYSATRAAAAMATGITTAPPRPGNVILPRRGQMITAVLEGRSNRV